MDNTLQHHGVLGQRWGHRRFQNKDGSLKPAGLARVKKDFSDSHSEYKTKRGESFYISNKVEDPRKTSRYQALSVREKNNKLATYTVDKKYNAIVAKIIETDGKKQITSIKDSDIARGEQFIQELLSKQQKQWDKEG